MDHGDVIISFSEVSFAYNRNKPILKEVNFSVRENAKITIMGQNGAGKSTIFKLISGELKPNKGSVNVRRDATIGIASQVMPRASMELTVKEFFESAFKDKKYDIDRDIKRVLELVNLSVPSHWKIGDLSGGQQARMLLAQAIIHEPDILLLDEPTNNLDTQGIDHLITFLLGYEKTVIVISHDAAFLNLFTHGVLHLDVFTNQVQQYVGDYYDVVDEIQAQILREQRQNAQLKKNIIDRKEKVNQFSHKGGKMRRLASKLKDEIAEDEEDMVSVRKEDKTIRPFKIPVQEFSGSVAHLDEITIIRDGGPISKEVDIEIHKGDMLLMTGPNGIGKTTMLEALASDAHDGMTIKKDLRVGYYRQDFSGLNYEQTPFKALEEIKLKGGEQEIYEAAAHFLLTGDLLQNPIGSLSEGQKGLLSYARFMMQQPALLILDEPTNHINFRHLPVIAKALNDFAGAIIVVSHDEEFVDQLNINQTLDLEKRFN
ncbi:MAG: ABC-F family ATP-binding cassette domain-containing protein [bacterium]|nr:ABC-F family ATP-binding cassette domain-containing protein [bacterium]